MPITPRDSTTQDAPPIAYGAIGASQTPVNTQAADVSPTTPVASPAPVDTQAPTVKNDGDSPRAKTTGRTGLLRKIIIGAGVLAIAVAAAVGIGVVNNLDRAPVSPVAPINTPVEVHPGGLPNGQAPPGANETQPGEVDVPVRGPTLPGSGAIDTQPETTPRTVSPFEIRLPDNQVSPTTPRINPNR